MSLTKAKLIEKKGYNFIFELENETQIEVKTSKDNESLSELLNKHINKAQRMDLYFNIKVSPSSSGIWLNECVLLTEVKKEQTIEQSIKPKEEVEFKTGNEIETGFQKLNKVKCNVEKKGRFNYVSWTDCWLEVKRHDPNAMFKVYENPDGFPAWIKKDIGGFVKVGVTINELEYIEHYQITDSYNKAILNPNVVDINNAIKRGMVKACAYHGLGLYVFQGEDLPEDAE